MSKVPEGWEHCYVQDVLNICNNLRKPISQEVRATIQGIFPYYGPTKVQDYIATYEQDGLYALIGEDGDHFLKYKTVSQTQLVNGKCTVNNHAHVIQGTLKCSSEWFYNYFKNRDITNFLSRQGAGRFKLNKATLGKLPLLVPPVVEQQKIAKILSAWDKAISVTEQLIGKSQQQKKMLMKLLMTNFGTSNQYGKWRYFFFENIASLGKKKFNPKVTNCITECIELEHISQGGSVLLGSTTTEIAISTKSVFVKGNVLFGKLRPYLRKYWLADRGGVCSTEIWVLIANEKILIPEYLHQLVQMDFFIDAANMASGTHMPRADWDVVKNVRVSLPPLEEQQKIAQVLSAADREIELLQQKLASLKQEKQALMQQLLTGKRRVAL
jgi:type I restriction enzyme, S subunit